MDHEASGNSKESSKEKGSSPNTTPKSLNGMTILKLVCTLLQWLLLNDC